MARFSRDPDEASLLAGDFEDFGVPLKDAPIVSLRSLEDGPSACELRHNSFWRRLLMILRRQNAGQRTDEQRPLRKPSKYEKLNKRSNKPRWRRRISRMCIAIPILVLSFFGIVHLVNVFMSMVPILWDDDPHPFLPGWGEPGELGEGLANYPTDFTRDVIPIPCHSHNDYWRRIPLYQALHYGCTGVEADVWLFDEELYVGHNTISLTRNRTFRNLYVDPLVEILVVLLVDFKSSGEALWPYVVEQLSALRSKNYLTHFDGRSVLPGPVTVVATGNAPFDLLIANSTYRDIFFDAPLADMWEEPKEGFPPNGAFHRHRPDREGNGIPSSQGNSFNRKLAERGNGGQGNTGTGDVTSPDAFTNMNSYYASVSFTKTIGRIWGGRISAQQMRLIRGHIQGAKKRGLKARYWDTPSWPIGLRNHVWAVLVREGVDMLNVDNLRAAARSDWKRKNHHGWL
ncbi:hypothetical protein AOQ84DRAFT_346967 [Glonium stellatum]|uniref:Altered inheritance of mitochondria protein 6 n=1 Tax=Glonium stellatum TaxID=574774 RepID=A0A8E2ESB6_9PEZI|nr:hypothetical protein AOQ84DRAFT_346967 [Glonium stellatum]